jgi:hypothetical protein
MSEKIKILILRFLHILSGIGVALALIVAVIFIVLAILQKCTTVQ